MPILELKADGSAIRRILRAISDALPRRGRTSADKPHPGVEISGDRGHAKNRAVGHDRQLWFSEARSMRTSLETTRVFRSSTPSLRRPEAGSTQTRHQRSNVAVSLLLRSARHVAETHLRRIANQELYGCDSTRHRRGSGSATFIPMMKPAHLWDRDDPPSFRSLDRA